MGWLEVLQKFVPSDEAYKDAIQPASRELGSALRASVKAARRIVAPLEFLAAHHERYEKYLERVASKVPDENLVKGNPQICGPALNALEFVDPESILAEFFVNLLARAIDAERQSQAHPAFVELIKQLSPDEAIILYETKCGELRFCSHQTNVNGNPVLSLDGFSIDTHVLAFPANLQMYVNHLILLNLVEVYQISSNPPTKSDSGVETYHTNMGAQFTQFGQLFSEACVPKEWVVHGAV